MKYLRILRVGRLPLILKLIITVTFCIGSIFTEPAVIRAQSAISVDQALMKSILPSAELFSEKSGDPPVYRAYDVNEGGEQVLVGYLFETPDLPPEEIGYSAPIDVLIGMDLSGTVTGIQILYYRESYRSIRGDFLHTERFPDQFEGKTLEEGFRVGRDVDGVSRATISSWAVARGIRNAARRVAQAYLSDIPGITSGGGNAMEVLQAMTWGDMKSLGMVSDLTVNYPDNSSLQLSFAYMGKEELGELLVGNTDFSRAEREASNRTRAGQLLLVGIAGNANSAGNPFRPERLAVKQGENVYPTPRRQFVYVGSATEGKIKDQVSFAGAIVLNENIDIGQPFSLQYDVSANMGTFTDVEEVAYALPPVTLAVAQGMPWVDPDAASQGGTGEFDNESGFSRLINEAPWGQVVILLFLFGLVMTAFFRKSASLRWAALFCTFIYLGFADGGFLSISHITSGLNVGPSMYLNDAPLLLLLVFTMVTTLLWGRIFCSSLCPFGALQDFLTYLVPKRFQIKVPQQIHDRAIFIKYGILIFILGMALAAGDVSVFQYFEPFGTVFFWSQSLLLWVILLAFLLASSVIKRFYCRYACPLGAALGVVSLISPNRIKRVAQCDVCKVCEHSCPTAAIRGPEIDFKECVRCDLCEIKLIARSGVCQHSIEDVKARVKDWQPVSVS